jgi:general secretion pathway protein L
LNAKTSSAAKAGLFNAMTPSHAHPGTAASPGLLVPAGVCLVPTEAVLLLAQSMPRMSAAQRRAAIAFAVEDRIAQPLDSVHVILGPALPDTAGQSSWLVAVVARAVLAQLRASAPKKARLVPDVLLLPVPAGDQWSVWASGARVLVRTADGAGFATVAEALPLFHLAAGRPDFVLYGDPLDPQFRIAGQATLPAMFDTALSKFDLQVPRQQQGTLMPQTSTWRRLAAVLACAAVGHGAILATDVWALGRMKAKSQDDLRQMLQSAGQPAEADLDLTINQMLAQGADVTAPRFLPLMTRAYAVLSAAGSGVTTSDLRYVGQDNTLMLTLQAPDIATLQDIETALSGAGMAVVAGAATNADGLAQQQLTLQGAAP